MFEEERSARVTWCTVLNEHIIRILVIARPEYYATLDISANHNHEGPERSPRVQRSSKVRELLSKVKDQSFNFTC